MSQQLLEKYLWGAATAFLVTIDAGDTKNIFFCYSFSSAFAMYMM
jgi:hypothetical protein